MLLRSGALHTKANLRVQNLRTAERLKPRFQVGPARGGVAAAGRRAAREDRIRAVLPAERLCESAGRAARVRDAAARDQSSDGVFTQQFHAWASGVNVSVKLECAAFPQASRAVQSGHFTAILPKIARVDLPADAFWELDDPFLNKRPRQMCLAWNPRTMRLRLEAQELATRLAEALKFE